MITQIQGQYRTRLSFKIPVVLKKKLVCVKYAMKDFFSQNILIRSQKEKNYPKNTHITNYFTRYMTQPCRFICL